MAYPYSLTLAKGVALTFTKTRMIVNYPGAREISLKRPAEEILFLLKMMQETGIVQEAIVQDLIDQGGFAQAQLFLKFLDLFNQYGYVCRTINPMDIGPFATFEPQQGRFLWHNHEESDSNTYCLSRFSYLRTDDGHLILENPLGKGRIHLIHTASMSIIHALAKPQTLKTLCKEIPAVSSNEILGFLNQLLNMSAIRCVEGKDESSASHVEHWDFHDLLLYQSSQPRASNAYNMSAETEQKQPQLPLHFGRPQWASVDFAEETIRDASLFDLLKIRNEHEAESSSGLTVKHHGEILYCALGHDYDYTSDKSDERPSPALDIYILAAHSPDLTAGLYRYDPKLHMLTNISTTREDRESLLDSILPPGAACRFDHLTAVILSAQKTKDQSLHRGAYRNDIIMAGMLSQTIRHIADSMDIVTIIRNTVDGELFSRIIAQDKLDNPAMFSVILGFNE